MKHRPNHPARLNAKPPLCQDKRAYVRRHEAEAVKQEQELLQPDLKLEIYRCLHAHHWHLTRKPIV